MSGKKVDWDFRFIMTVMVATILFGTWLCFKAYPAQSDAVLDLTLQIGLPIAGVLLGIYGIVRFRRWKQAELAKEAEAARGR